MKCYIALMADDVITSVDVDVSIGELLALQRVAHALNMAAVEEGPHAPWMQIDGQSSWEGVV